MTYVVERHVNQISDGRATLRAGTLYTALDRLEADGVIAVDREEVVDNRLRRYYRLTPAGGARLADEAARLSPQAGVERARDAAAPTVGLMYLGGLVQLGVLAVVATTAGRLHSAILAHDHGYTAAQWQAAALRAHRSRFMRHWHSTPLSAGASISSGTSMSTRKPVVSARQRSRRWPIVMNLDMGDAGQGQRGVGQQPRGGRRQTAPGEVRVDPVADLEPVASNPTV